MNVHHYHVALKLKETAPTSKTPMNALRVMRDFRCTKINVLVCTDQLKFVRSNSAKS